MMKTMLQEWLYRHPEWGRKEVWKTALKVALAGPGTVAAGMALMLSGCGGPEKVCRTTYKIQVEAGQPVMDVQYVICVVSDASLGKMKVECWNGTIFAQIPDYAVMAVSFEKGKTVCQEVEK